MLPDIDGVTLLKRLRQDGVGRPGALPHRPGRTVQPGRGSGRRRRRLRHEAVHASPKSSRACTPSCAAPAAKPAGDTALRFADLVMDEDTREVWRGGTTRSSSPRPSSTCCGSSCCNPTRVLSKAQILDAVWHYDFGGNPNVVETYVSYLRKKLDRLGPPLIQTIRLVGYALREPEA